MQVPLLTHGGPTTGPSTSATRYGPFANGGAAGTWSGTMGGAATPIAEAGIISGLTARFPSALSTGSYTITLVKNGADTALTCTITSASLTAEDVTHTVSVAAGDKVCWKVVPTGGPAPQTVVQIAALLTVTASGKGMLFATAASDTIAGFVPLGGAGLLTEDRATCVMPCAGTISSLYVSLSAAPGSGNSRTYTLRKNGVDTGVTVTVSNSAADANVAVSPVSFAAGDSVVVAGTISGTPASATALIGMDWAPSTDGETPVFTTWNNSLPTANTRNAALGNASSGENTEANALSVAPTHLVFRKMYAAVVTAPGSGKSRTFTLRQNSISTSLSAAITDASTAANDNSHQISVAKGDLLSVFFSPSGTPAATAGSRVGMVAYIAPGGAPPPRRRHLLLLGVGR